MKKKKKQILTILKLKENSLDFLPDEGWELLAGTIECIRTILAGSAIFFLGALRARSCSQFRPLYITPDRLSISHYTSKRIPWQIATDR